MKSTNQQHLPKYSTNRLFFLILSCSGGAGLIRAAEALHSNAPLTGLPIRTEHYDVLNFTLRLFKRFYSGPYIQMVNRAPELWGYLYQQSERKPYERKGLIKRFDQLNYKRYLRTLREFRTDTIICTHFLPYLSVSSELHKTILQLLFLLQLQISMFINFGSILLSRGILYSTKSQHGSFTGKQNKGNWNFYHARISIRRRLGFKMNYFTLLVLSGGFGIGRMKEIVEQIAFTLNAFPKRKFNLLIVCGKNDSARAELQAVYFPKNIDRHIFGFVTTIHELMDASDLLISKAGGLTSSEAMAKSLIIDPIPGQESCNTDLIVEHGAGWKSINPANLSYKLQHILETPSLLTKGQTATHHLAKPNTATTILTDVYNFLCYQKEKEK